MHHARVVEIHELLLLFVDSARVPAKGRKLLEERFGKGNVI